MIRSAVRPVVLALAAALSAGVAAAHGPGVEGLDLAALEDLAASRVLSTADGDRKVHRSWLRLAKVLARESRRGLPDDVRKVAVALKAATGPLAGDGQLAGRVADAVSAADAALSGMPDEAEEWIDRIAADRDRDRTARAALRARDRHLAGRALGPADGRKRLSLWRRAAAGFAKTWKVADRAIDRQGGPLDPTVPGDAGRVYTVAGTGEGGWNGDGLPARRSSLYWVEEVKFDPSGRLVILDWNNHMVRRLEPDGTLARLCGAGVPGDSEGDPLATELNHPSAVDFDAAGRIYIAAWHNHKVKVLDPTGPVPAVRTVAGGPAGNAGDGGPATAARFNLVPGVLLLPPGHPFGGGDLLVTDASNQCVRSVRLASEPVTAVNVAGATVDTGVVRRVFGTGVRGTEGDGGAAASARLGFSSAQNAESDGRMTLGPDGSVYIVCGVEHVVRRVAPDGTISTVAGSGEAGYAGDGGPATAARLDFPGDVAVAADGTLFISDQNNHVVRRVSPGGTIGTLAGVAGSPGYSGDGGPAGEALFRRPAGLELDADGNLYVCDKGNSVIRVIASAAPGALRVPREPFRFPAAPRGVPPAPGPPGTIATFAGTGRAAFNGDGRPALETDLYWPQDVTVNPATGQLYVADWNNHRLRRVEDDGSVATVVGAGDLGDTDGPALTVRMNHPTDLAFHPVTGELWFAAWHTDRVKRVDGATNRVVTVNRPDGARSFSGDGGPVGQAELNLPVGVEFDSAGNVFIADEGNRRVRRVDAATGIITTVAGSGLAGFSGDGGPATEARLNLPVGQSAQPAGRVAIDPTDRYLYVADTDNHRVRRVDLQTGIIATVAGNGAAAMAGDGGPATAASLSSPVDVDCDAAGNLFVCDRDNHAVRRVDAVTGVITTVAGNGLPGYAGDGGPGSAARLFLPGGIHVDRSTGRLYVADTFNGVVRVVWE